MRPLIATLFVQMLCLSLLTACERDDGRFSNLPPLAGQAVAVGVVGSIVQTKIERHMEVDCSALNLLSDGSYCVSKYKPTDRQEVFCFKTLGTVDCYAEPDPYSLEGRQLPGPPRALADPRMPMQPPGRRSNPPQVATAPIGQTTATVTTVEEPEEDD